MIKFILPVVLSISATLAFGTIFMKMVPEYEVEFSAGSGHCKKVDHKGTEVPNGCTLVRNGQLTRYSSVQGY